MSLLRSAPDAVQRDTSSARAAGTASASRNTARKATRDTLTDGPLSLGLLKNLATDQHAPDFRRAGADLVELGVAQQAAGRIVVDITVAAENLDRVQRQLGRLLGREENGAGGVLEIGRAHV